MCGSRAHVHHFGATAAPANVFKDRQTFKKGTEKFGVESSSPSMTRALSSLSCGPD